jgi:hypothetical protein
VLPCNRVRPSADTPCSRSLPIRGRAGVSLSTLCSGLLPSGGAAQTNMVPACPCTDQYWLALRVRAGASCVCRLRCPSASPPGHVSQGASRIVGLGNWPLDFRSNRAKPFPSVWGRLATAFIMRSGRHRPGRIAFQRPSSLRCCSQTLSRNGIACVSRFAASCGLNSRISSGFFAAGRRSTVGSSSVTY